MKASKPRRVRPDWLAIKHEYVCGNESLEALAERHGISPGVVMEHSAREGWVDSRAEFGARVTRSVVTAAVKARVRSEMEMDAGAHGVSTEVFSKLIGVLSARKQPAPATLNGVMRTATEAYRLQRESAGLPREKLPAPVPPNAGRTVRIRLQGPDGSELIVSDGDPSEDGSRTEPTDPPTPPKPGCVGDDSAGS